MPRSETNGNRQSYPGSSVSFAALLSWHVQIWGTRAGGSPDKPGKPWTKKEFAEHFRSSTDSLENARKKVANWLTGKHPPSDFRPIERVLFGDAEALKDSDPYEIWRVDLRRTYSGPDQPSIATRIASTDEAVKEALESSLRLKRLVSISGSRFEFTREQLRFSISDKEFRIPFPVEHRCTLNEVAPKFSVYELSESTLGETLITDAEELIADIRDVLHAAALNRAKNFIQRALHSQPVFNAELFHVLQFSLAADRDEHPDLTIQLYKSDYFTLQTLNRAFFTIRQRNAPSLNLEDSIVRHKLRLFWNGFGLCATVCAIVEDSNANADKIAGPVLVFGRRGRGVSANEATGTWHVTANEALTVKDIRDQRISIADFINRGLHEEAGIDSSQVLRNYVLNVFLSLQEMQPAMNVLSFCRVSDLSSIFHHIAGSQDGQIEYDDYTFLPFREADIRNALARGGLNDMSGSLVPFSPASDNLLRCVIARGINSFTY